MVGKAYRNTTVPKSQRPEVLARPSDWRTANKSHMRRKKFLELYAEGFSVKDCCEKLTIGVSAYDHWRKRHPEFAAEVDRIRGTTRGSRQIDAGTFTGFRKRYFGFDTYPHQARIIYEIENASPGEVVLILVPPEWGKTTLLEDYCNYRIAKDPNVRITLVSEGQPHARKILGRVQKRMADPMIAADYIADFGPFISTRSEQMGKRWSADAFTVLRASHDERDYTMEARGWKSRIAGTRTDLLLIDDIQSAVSLNMTEKMLTSFRQDMLTRPGRSGVTIIVGTRVGNYDFYEAIQNEGIVDRTVVLSAVNDHGESNCPEMWPTEDLMARKGKVGDDVWWRTYMQKPRMGGSSTFTMELLDKAKDLTRSLGDRPTSGLGILGLDPALTNWNCFVMTVATNDGLHVVDVRRDRLLGSTEQVLAKLDVLAVLYRPDVVVVEGNAYQKGLVNDLRLRELSRQRGFIVVEHETGRNKLDESLGVGRMPTSFVQGKISIPWGDERSRHTFEPFIGELHNWRANVPTRQLRQDMVMALWFCWLEWQRRVNTIGQDRPNWKARGLPWRALGNPIRAGKAS